MWHQDLVLESTQSQLLLESIEIRLHEESTVILEDSSWQQLPPSRLEKMASTAAKSECTEVTSERIEVRLESIEVKSESTLERLENIEERRQLSCTWAKLESSAAKQDCLTKRKR